MRPFQRLLLTGGTGFVGKYLAPELVRKFPGAERFLLVNTALHTIPEGWQVLVADLRSEEAVEKAIADAKPDLVIHLAAQSSVAAGVASGETTIHINAGGSRNLASSVAVHAPWATFLFVSSSEVYGRSFLTGPVDEAAATEPVSDYGVSKLQAERVLSTILPSSSKLLIARSFNHTGPGQDERFVLPSFAAQIARIEAGRHEPWIEVGNLAVRRDFLHVRDVVDAYISLLEASSELPRLTTVNVSSGRNYQLSELLEKMQSMSRASFEIRVSAERWRQSDLPEVAGLNHEIVRITGWTPRYTVDEMLTQLLDYWRSAV